MAPKNLWRLTVSNFSLILIKKIILLHKVIYLYNMGRNKINNNDKKVRISITINPINYVKIKERHINVSSLLNKLIDDYFKNEKM